jgi:hypothetical protein
MPADGGCDCCKNRTCSPHTCCSVRLSALALLKIAMHARSGGSIEVCML